MEILYLLALSTFFVPRSGAYPTQGPTSIIVNATNGPGPHSPSLVLPSSNPLKVPIAGTAASLRFSDFHELLDAGKLSALLIKNLHKIILEVTQGGHGDRPVGADYQISTVGIIIQIYNHAEGQGLTFGEVGNVLAGIGTLIGTLEPRDCMFDYLDHGQPVTYGYLMYENIRTREIELVGRSGR